MEANPPLDVSVVYSPQARVVREVQLRLAAGSTVLQAVQASGFLQLPLPTLQPLEATHLHPLEVGVWGRKAALQQTLRQQDRVEIYRPLRVDPKVARRERFVKQGSRMAGLFAKPPDGGKVGS